MVPSPPSPQLAERTFNAVTSLHRTGHHEHFGTNQGAAWPQAMPLEIPKQRCGRTFEREHDPRHGERGELHLQELPSVVKLLRPYALLVRRGALDNIGEANTRGERPIVFEAVPAREQTGAG